MKAYKKLNSLFLRAATLSSYNKQQTQKNLYLCNFIEEHVHLFQGEGIMQRL